MKRVKGMTGLPAPLNSLILFMLFIPFARPLRGEEVRAEEAVDLRPGDVEAGLAAAELNVGERGLEGHQAGKLDSIPDGGRFGEADAAFVGAAGVVVEDHHAGDDDDPAQDMA